MATAIETKKGKWLGGGEAMIDGTRVKIGGKDLQKLQGVSPGTMFDFDVKSIARGDSKISPTNTATLPRRR